MNILVQDIILNYANIHLLGKTSLDLSIVSVFHLVYQTVTSHKQTPHGFDLHSLE